MDNKYKRSDGWRNPRVSEAYDRFAVQSCCLQERFKLRVIYNMLVILFI